MAYSHSTMKMNITFFQANLHFSENSLTYVQLQFSTETTIRRTLLAMENEASTVPSQQE